MRETLILFPGYNLSSVGLLCLVLIFNIVWVMNPLDNLKRAKNSFPEKKYIFGENYPYSFRGSMDILKAVQK